MKHKNRILIIDDEADITLMFQIALGENNFSVDIFNDPLIALKEYKPGQYDLIIIDLLLPEMDGYQLSQKLREKDKQTKMCFITASEKYRQEYREKEKNMPEFNEHNLLLKPIEIGELIEKINKILLE